ncbi:hypothetical protein BAMA_00330 [Bacillus manliponensis]|uniref:Cell cycle protein n=1 Tax=Bacillus manliponensis TaxID=574376 RepID=A0A073K1N6_9BACI|nr:FtsW/RodA/SpoVE family cell cycle protein [Bacillus manliponensis]KEK21254.1 hypothetical protein BAMA_00330 [Bacillus manliponensis]
MEKQGRQFKLDFYLIGILVLLAVFSVIAIKGAQPLLPEKLQGINFASKQMFWFICGAIMAGIVMIIDYDRYQHIIWYLYGICFILLLGLKLEVPGALRINGAVAWYKLPAIGNFQPSEPMKIIIILLVAKIIANHNKQFTSPRLQDDFLLIGKVVGVVLPPLALIAMQPDLGHVMVISFITCTMLLVSGIRWRIIITVAVAGMSAITGFLLIYFKFPHLLGMLFAKDYQLDRFYGWLSPHDYPTQGYQLVNSMLAIGSGELTGKGHLQGNVYFPEAHTDFIFAVVAEQFGFIGACMLISLYFLLIYRMLMIALESNDTYGTYICCGFIGLITFQVFQNIGMTIGLLPITGITLPFMSYGGSSLVLSYMVGIGLILNVHSRTRTYMFDSSND